MARRRLVVAVITFDEVAGFAEGNGLNIEKGLALS
jgi:hypothetical protein